MGRTRRWPLVTALTRFWADDRGLSIFTVLLLVVIFVLPPLLPPGTGRSRAGDVVYALLLLSGVLASRTSTRLLLLPAAAVAIAAHFGSWFLPLPEPWVLGTNVAALLVFLTVVLTQTLRAGPVTFHRIQGAVAAYLMLGLLWGHAYALVASLWPAAFSGAPQRRGRSAGLLLLQLRDLDHRRLRRHPARASGGAIPRHARGGDGPALPGDTGRAAGLPLGCLPAAERAGAEKR